MDKEKLRQAFRAYLRESELNEVTANKFPAKTILKSFIEKLCNGKLFKEYNLNYITPHTCTDLDVRSYDQGLLVTLDIKAPYNQVIELAKIIREKYSNVARIGYVELKGTGIKEERHLTNGFTTILAPDAKVVEIYLEKK